jgi:voltage-gated potassium channel
MSPRRLHDLEPKERRRAILRAGSIVLLAWVVLIGAYSAIAFAAWPGVTLPAVIGAITVFGIVLMRQVRGILASDVPEVRAVQALGALVPLYLVMFAAIYVAMPDDTFSQPLDHTSAFYFTVTVFATVGFGDITPVSELGQVVVSTQMILNLVLLGAIARFVFQVARRTLDEAPGDGVDQPFGRP